MFGFKKKFHPIAEYEESWTVKQGTYDGAPILIRIQSGLKKAVGHPEYPFQMGVAVPLLKPSETGMPDRDEISLLDPIEDRLVEVLGSQGAVLTAVVTTGKMREFVFYAREWKPEELDQMVKQVEAEVGSHRIQFIMRHDPDWAVYDSF